jgi:hypothetical protein
LTPRGYGLTLGADILTHLVLPLLFVLTAAAHAEENVTRSRIAPPVLVNESGEAIGSLAPPMSNQQVATVVLRMNEVSLPVGLAVHQTRDEATASLSLSLGGSDEAGSVLLSSGLHWSLGYRSYLSVDCSGTGYIALPRGLGAGSSWGGERVTVAYRSGTRYFMAISKPTVHNLSVQTFGSARTPEGACVPDNGESAAIPIERSESLDSYGAGPFFIRTIAPGQNAPRAASVAAAMLADSAGNGVGQVVSSNSDAHAAIVILHGGLDNLVVGLAAHRGSPSGQILSSGFTWAVGQRSFEGTDCTGPEYIAFGAGSSAGGTRLTVAYREGSQYTLAVSKPAAGNLSRRARQSYVDQLGRCQPSSGSLVAIDVERRISLERFGSPPFFWR